MISILSPASVVGPLDPCLRALLQRSFASMITPHGDLTEWTEWLIVEPGDSEEDIIREVGFSPLIEPIDGARYRTEGFQPFWDQLVQHDGWWEMVVSYGSTFAYIVFIQDAEGVPPALLSLCREYAR